MIDSVNKYTIEDVLDEISRHPDALIYVGTDSRQSKFHTTMVTVVVVHYGAKDGNGRGCKVYPFVEVLPKIRELKQRLMTEVTTAVQYGLDIVYDSEGEVRIPPERIEVHMDINPNPRHKSSIAVKEALAFVQGQQMVPKFKPYALAATGTSDFIGRKHHLKSA